MSSKTGWWEDLPVRIIGFLRFLLSHWFAVTVVLALVASATFIHYFPPGQEVSSEVRTSQAPATQTGQVQGPAGQVDKAETTGILVSLAANAKTIVISIVLIFALMSLRPVFYKLPDYLNEMRKGQVVMEEGPLSESEQQEKDKKDKDKGIKPHEPPIGRWSRLLKLVPFLERQEFKDEAKKVAVVTIAVWCIHLAALWGTTNGWDFVHSGYFNLFAPNPFLWLLWVLGPIAAIYLVAVHNYGQYYALGIVLFMIYGMLTVDRRWDTQDGLPAPGSSVASVIGDSLSDFGSWVGTKINSLSGTTIFGAGRSRNVSGVDGRPITSESMSLEDIEKMLPPSDRAALEKYVGRHDTGDDPAPIREQRIRGLIAVEWPESRNRQFNDDGTPYKNPSSSAVGKFQILLKDHADELRKLGLDAEHSADDNIHYAAILEDRAYHKTGDGLTTDWLASKDVWGPLIRGERINQEINPRELPIQHITIHTEGNDVLTKVIVRDVDIPFGYCGYVYAAMGIPFIAQNEWGKEFQLPKEGIGEWSTLQFRSSEPAEIIYEFWPEPPNGDMRQCSAERAFHKN